MAAVSPQTWERALLPLAYEAEHQEVIQTPPPDARYSLAQSRLCLLRFDYLHAQSDFHHGNQPAAARETASDAGALCLLPLER